MKRAILCGVFGLVLAARVSAIVDFTPPWVANPSDPKYAGGSATYQAWEFWGNPPGTTAPAHVDNPYGQPGFTPRGMSPQFVSNGPGLTGVNTWHVDVDGGGFDLFIPNDPQNRPFKEINLQFTSDRATFGNAAPTVQPGGSMAAGGVAGHGPSDGGDSWYTYEYKITIQPNPAFEYISVNFPASANIGEIDVFTICYTPEPTTLCLLALGAWGIVRRRRE
jgi:hypothetical protein